MNALNILRVLLVKEIRQLLRNRQIIALVLMPPVLQLVLFGLSLDPNLHAIPFVTADQSVNAQSRELIASLEHDSTFTRIEPNLTPNQATKEIRRGKAALALVIPPDFARTLTRDGIGNVQILIDGVNAYIAGLAAADAQALLTDAFKPIGARAIPDIQTTYDYNPGLVSSWFFVTGTISVMVIFVGLLISGVEGIREKETGTLEQLLMTPAPPTVLVTAKLIPLTGLVLASHAIAVVVARVGFQVPMRGSLIAFFLVSALAALGGVSMGLTLATLARNRRQVILASIFIALPMTQLSGAIAPLESMPPFFRALTIVNPLRHFAFTTRGIWLKGAGVGAYFPSVIMLALFALLTTAVTMAAYRNQLR